jgi:hypothetical protein
MASRSVGVEGEGRLPVEKSREKGLTPVIR